MINFLKKGVIMFVNEELDTLYRKLDYAIWQKEATRNSEYFQETIELIDYYKKEISKISHKKTVLKQLTLF